MNNLCQLALQKGGSLNYLMLPATITDGFGLTNPSIFIHNGHYFLNLRHVQYALYHSEGEQKFQSSWGPLAYLNPEDDLTLKTTNYFCELDPNTLTIDKYQKIDTSKLDVKPLWEFIGLEDARVVYWDNSLYLSGVRRDTTTNGEGRMELSTIDNKNKETKRVRIEPPTKGSYCEKNWMPILDLPYHYVKWSSPTEVVKVDPIKGISETVFSVEQKIKFPRDIRGGSQVITIGNYYVAITHEVDLWHNEQGKKDAQYYHRFIIWDKKWNIVAHSSELKFMTGAIEFTCGLAFDGNDIIIPFGFQDSTAFILKFPINLLETLCDLKLVKPTIKKALISATPKKLENYIYEPYNEDVTFELGEYYFLNGHYSSAMSFYLRTAEYSKNPNKTYEALLMTAKCLSTLKRRDVTELGLWLNALNFDIERPEAYLFISEYYERQKKYNQMYSYAILGLKYYANAKPITANIGYEASYQLTFQKGVSAWWIGRGSEAREIFLDLVVNANILSDKYKKLVQSNITSLGSGPDPFLRYHKGLHDQLKYKFPGSELIEKNFSQSYQDMFALSMVNGKKNGTYFEIGAADPFHGNNTALLEKVGWTGTSLEILEHEVNKFKQQRKNEVILCDATKFDYSVLKGHIDYLQVDCEPPETTYQILTMLPWNQCTFGVITYEHDHYTDITQSFRKKSREFLLNKGYILIVSNISHSRDNCPYEDWWVHPKHIDKDIIKKMLADDDSIKNAEKYMFGKL
jgi:tetratricopeptide (TPR) repeat protein